jgi:hypothetical protein
MAFFIFHLRVGIRLAIRKLALVEDYSRGKILP